MLAWSRHMYAHQLQEIQLRTGPDNHECSQGLCLGVELGFLQHGVSRWEGGLDFGATRARLKGAVERMGAILSEPVTAMVVERCSSPQWAAAAVTMQGWRRTHEDAHILCNLESGGSLGSASPGVFAVLDGHGGSSAALEGAKLLEDQLKSVATCGIRSPAEASRLLQDAFIDCDERLRQQLGQEDRSGSTVVACIINPARGNEYTVQLAHAGDSRAVLCRGGRLHCSKDHKPNREDEARRIEAAGGCVSQGPLGGGPMRVDGALAVSRALGDFHFKPSGMDPAKCKVSVVPEVQTVEGCTSGDWVLLACDGIFDVMENDEVKDFVESHSSRSAKKADGAQVCIDMLKLCLDKGSKDDVEPGTTGCKGGPGSGIQVRHVKDNCTICLVQFGENFPVRTKTAELLPGPWKAASPEVQNKYAEFFRGHGFEAEANEMTSSGRRLSGSSAGKTKQAQAASPAQPAPRNAPPTPPAGGAQRLRVYRLHYSERPSELLRQGDPGGPFDPGDPISLARTEDLECLGVCLRGPRCDGVGLAEEAPLRMI
eukprot:s1997_g3.t3